MNNRVLLAAACGLLAAACDPQPQGRTTTPGTSAEPGVGTSAAEQAQPPPKLPPPTPDERTSLAKAGNAFAFDLYAKVRAGGGDVAISPLSVTTALTMTWAGARGETADEMKKVLHEGGAAEAAVDAAGKLVSSLSAGDKVTLRVANRLFGDKAYAFEKPFLDRTAAAFGAPLEPVDFAKDPEGSRAHINGWVAKQTNQRILNLLPPNSIDKSTRLVLTNAIFFLGDWVQPFDKQRTAPAAFHASASSSRDVPTMKQVAHFQLAAAGGVRVLDLPYAGGELTMTIVLPDAVDGLGALEGKLDLPTFDGWIAALADAKVDVALPRFVIDPADPLELSRPLKELGMSLAFDKDRADFTAIGNPPDKRDRLHVSKVFHKAFVKVDEKGTEAAAASAVTMAKGGGAPHPEETKEFHADHPFLFFLRAKASNMILFMGRVTDPKG